VNRAAGELNLHQTRISTKNPGLEMRGDKMSPCRLDMASPFLYWIGSFIRYLKKGIQMYDNKNLLLGVNKNCYAIFLVKFACR